MVSLFGRGFDSRQLHSRHAKARQDDVLAGFRVVLVLSCFQVGAPFLVRGNDALGRLLLRWIL